MEVPELLKRRVENEPRELVALDGEDVAVFTRDRTYIYRGESLLRDAAVEVYRHDIERLAVSPGRRKTTFELTYVDGTDEFAVSSEFAEAVLEGLFGGVLASAGVLEEGESIRGVYLFSDLTVVVTDARLVKHIGAAVWDGDYEEYPFASVTGLEFEEGDVATQVVLWVGGRAERIKAPSEEAPLLQRTLTRALCEFHDVDSLEQLNAQLAPETESGSNSSIVLDEDISPLIGTAESDESPDSDEQVEDWTEFDLDTGGSESAERSGVERESNSDSGAGTARHSATRASTGAQSGTDGTDIAALERRLTELTRTVERQNELLERQGRRLSELADRLDSERD